MNAHFEAKHDDVVLGSAVKTGTTWLKAIVATIMSYKENNGKILEQRGPHDLIPTLEVQCYGLMAVPSVLSNMGSPRILHSHLPYTALPHSITSQHSPIIYIARNPKDTFVSYWKYVTKFLNPAINIHEHFSMGQLFDYFCNGVCFYGPYLDHVLSYWKASQGKDSSHILFLMYEDLMADTQLYVRKIAEFLGCTGLTEEEVKDIARQCSFQSLSRMNVNENGSVPINNVPLDNKALFRKGQVGDWKNYFTPEMNSRMDSIVEKKLEGSRLQFIYELNDA